MDEYEPTSRWVLDVQVDIADTLKLDLIMIENLWVQNHARLGPATDRILVPLGLGDPGVDARRAVAPQDTERRWTRCLSIAEADKVYTVRGICDSKAGPTQLL